jgi:hypothetical protein
MKRYRGTTKHRGFRALWALFVVVAGSGGCLNFTASGEHAEHAHHEIPVHRPSNFPHGVRRLRYRLEQFATTLTLDDAKLSERKYSELRDIVRWLPELAGESDLPEPEWEQVVAATQSIQQQLPPWPEQERWLTASRWQELCEACEPSLARLDMIAKHASFKTPFHPDVQLEATSP